MDKLRLLITEECNRNCEGCCNKDFDLKALPELTLDENDTLKSFNKIMLTGGEPMLNPLFIAETVGNIRFWAPFADIYVYTAKVDNLKDTVLVLGHLDGLTLTLHEQKDIEPFMKLNDFLNKTNLMTGIFKSLRLNIFKGVELPKMWNNEYCDYILWDIKDNIEWIKDCPLPEGEVFMRLEGI
jgi:hypothetical protein